MLSIRISGLEDIRRLLGRDLQGAMRTATSAIANELKTEMAQAPGRVHRPIIWASRKQRAFVMMIRKGLGPYKRESDPQSQRLMASWAVTRWGTTGAKLGTRVTYAPYVQSSERQSEQHKATGWRTDRQAVGAMQRSGAIGRILKQAIRGVLRR